MRSEPRSFRLFLSQSIATVRGPAVQDLDLAFASRVSGLPAKVPALVPMILLRYLKFILPFTCIVAYSRRMQFMEMTLPNQLRLAFLLREAAWPLRADKRVQNVILVALRSVYAPDFLVRCLSDFGINSEVYQAACERIAGIFAMLLPDRAAHFADRLSRAIADSDLSMSKLRPLAERISQAGVGWSNLDYVNVDRSMDLPDGLNFQILSPRLIALPSHFALPINIGEPASVLRRPKIATSCRKLTNSVIIPCADSVPSAQAELSICLRIFACLASSLDRSALVVGRSEIFYRVERALKNEQCVEFVDPERSCQTLEATASRLLFAPKSEPTHWQVGKTLAQKIYPIAEDQLPLILTSTFAEFDESDYTALHERWPKSHSRYFDIQLHDPFEITARIGSHIKIVMGENLPTEYAFLLQGKDVTFFHRTGAQTAGVGRWEVLLKDLNARVEAI